MSTLSEIQKNPARLKKLDAAACNALAADLRAELFAAVRSSGGHLASNYGVVELTIALHRVLSLPTDMLIFDVGHQCYAHKLLSGRSLDGLRMRGGVSGFPCPEESPFDAFGTGHGSTALSAAAGLAAARDLKNESHNIVCVLGDGALTGGMAYEALNHLGASKSRVVIVLNDNGMSISKNVGAVSRSLSKLRLNRAYTRFKCGVKEGVLSLPFGRRIYGVLGSLKDALKFSFLSNKFFDSLGILYAGPVDGHDTESLTGFLKSALKEDKPVLLHIKTVKGKGLSAAESSPDIFHNLQSSGAGAGADEKNTDFSAAAGEALCEAAENDSRVCVISAAMPRGTGMGEFFTRFPERSFDVGIAEEHAVTMAAGLAAGGMRPFFAVYSTFLQRGFDQVLHDIALQKLPVVFLVDRAGLIGRDGATHQGVYDLSFLGCIPDIRILAPATADELKAMIEWSLTADIPVAIRYPHSAQELPFKSAGFCPYSWERVFPAGDGESISVCILAVGSRMLTEAVSAAKCLPPSESGGKPAVINARSIKPPDYKMLDELFESKTPIVTVEDNAAAGGFGSAVLLYAAQRGFATLITVLGVGDDFIRHGTVREQTEEAGISAPHIAAACRAALKAK